MPRAIRTAILLMYLQIVTFSAYCLSVAIVGNAVGQIIGILVVGNGIQLLFIWLVRRQVLFIRYLILVIGIFKVPTALAFFGNLHKNLEDFMHAGLVVAIQDATFFAATALTLIIAGLMLTPSASLWFKKLS